MGKVAASLVQAGRDQWDLLGQAAVEGAVAKQIDLGVVDLAAAEEQVDLEGAAVVQVGLAAVEGVH